MLPYFPENISNNEGGEGCLKKQVASRVFLPKKIEQLVVIYNRESNNKRRKKETMKTSRQTQCGKPNKRKGTSPSHPYSPSKNTTRTHAATGASSPPRTTSSKTKYEKRIAGPKLFPYGFRSPFMASRAFLTASPAKTNLTSKFSYLLFFSKPAVKS